jgi:hypothetical protein
MTPADFQTLVASRRALPPAYINVQAALAGAL